VPDQFCDGDLVEPEAAACGEGTNNPECDTVCEGDVVTTTKEAFGTIDLEGDSWRVGLGVGVASNGVNCALVGGSYVEGTLVTSGSAETEDWEATATAGDVVTIYSGGCLWAGDPDMDGDLEALAVGASVRFATGYQAEKL
jgi:hypothetical protein